MKYHDATASDNGPAESALPPRWPQPGELWSLIDLMRTVNAGLLLKLSDVVGDMAAKCEGADGDLSELGTFLADSLREFVSDLELPVTTSLMEHVRTATDGKQIGAAITMIRRSMVAELQQQTYLRIRDGLASYYDDVEPFGRAAIDKFPNSAEDIENASRCIALEQPTASVFHLMRAMEAAVGRLCQHLGISNPDRVWGQLLSDIGGKISAMPHGPERNEWSAAHVNLYHVKQAWRNDTMHPKQTYTVEQAVQVFQAMKVFMGHLAGLV